MQALLSPRARGRAGGLAGRTPPSACAETGARNRSLSRKSAVGARLPRRGGRRGARSASRESLGLERRSQSARAAVRARSQPAGGAGTFIMWTGVNHGRAFTSMLKKEEEALPHDQLREYGGRIHDLREITRPNLQYGTCVFKTNVPEALPHDQLREYGGRIHDLSQITRPGLSHGGMIPVEVISEYLSTGYGLRFSTEIYGCKREKTVFREYLQEACFVLTEIPGNLREFTGECNLGILYSSFLQTSPKISGNLREFTG